MLGHSQAKTPAGSGVAGNLGGDAKAVTVRTGNDPGH